MKPNDISKREQLVDEIGTHYVRKISYGGQMVASIKLKFSPNFSRYVVYFVFIQNYHPHYDFIWQTVIMHGQLTVSEAVLRERKKERHYTGDISIVSEFP